MNKKILSITILLFILFSISCVSANDLNDTQELESESVIAISNDNIENNGNLSSGVSSFTQLQNEVDKVPNGGVLKLNSDYNSAPKSWVNVDKDITINGQGHTIDCLGQDDSFAFKSTKGTIILENLIIKNSKTSNVFSYGGAIYIEGSAQYKIINCTFINNYASMSGGAIYNGVREKTLIIKNSKFINCTTKGSGGAIYSRGDAIVEDCIFENDQAHIDGGAICAHSVNIVNSKFTSNKVLESYTDASSFGGAVCVKEDAIVENCVFSNNYAYNSGGAIFAYNNIVVKNSSFTKNSAREGGAIYGLGTNTVIGSSIFTENKADTSHGGAIRSDKYVHIDNSTFLRNTAKGKGGAIFTYYLVFINPISFINNSASDHGGAIYTDYISNEISNIIFDGNHVDSDFGGAIYINKNSGNVKFINTTFINNHANAGDGGAIYSDSGSTNIALINSVFKNNYANGGKEKRYGGAIRCCNKLSIDNCTFMDNWAENLGGAVYTNLLESVKNSVFVSNRAKEGGAIYVNNKCTVSLLNSFFKSNRATDGRGGAIYTDSKSTKMAVNNNVFLGNDASGQGKDVFNSGSYSSISQNWWGTNSPAFNNEKLMEYHTIGSNERHSDNNPNKVSISSDKTGYVGVDTSLSCLHIQHFIL